MSAPNDAFNDHNSELPASETLAARLSPRDAELLDALVACDFDPAKVDAIAGPLTADDRTRVERLLAQFSLLDAYPEPDVSESDADTLVAATLARVRRSDEERERTFAIENHPAYAGTPAWRRFRWSDLVAVACVAIVGVSVIVPVVSWSRGRSLELACSNNLRTLASGVSTYSGDFGSLPMRASVLPDLSNWLTYRHSDNLKALTDHSYCTTGCLCCPGDHDPNGSYAYQVMAATKHPLWNAGPRIPLIGDRNPLIDLARGGESIAEVALNSESHNGRGQSLLFTDGSVDFLYAPYVAPSGMAKGPGDNIWLPYGNGASALRDRPSGNVDAFLLH